MIARAGIASRRDAEAMIARGPRDPERHRCSTSPALNVTRRRRASPSTASRCPRKERTRLWIFHKPRGLVTTARDPEGRPDRVREPARGPAAGRGDRPPRHQHRGAPAPHQRRRPRPGDRPSRTPAGCAATRCAPTARSPRPSSTACATASPSTAWNTAPSRRGSTASRATTSGSRSACARARTARSSASWSISACR